jgi:hypothetical protein
LYLGADVDTPTFAFNRHHPPPHRKGGENSLPITGDYCVPSDRGNKDRVMLLPKIRYKGPFYILLGRLHIDTDTDSAIANVQRSLGLADEHDVDLESSIIYATTRTRPT